MIRESWAVLCIIGVWGWILTGVGFILRVFPTRDAFNSKSAMLWGCCFIAFYFLWVVGMINS
jgi:hypothetical protein